MTRSPVIAAIVAAALATSIPAPAQEGLDEILQRFEGFVGDGNYPKALEELEWARRALAKAHWAKIEALFPDRLGEREGQSVERQELLGIQTHSRRYTGPTGETIEITLMDGSNSFGLAALEKLARLLGSPVGAELVRIDGLTATLVDRDGQGGSSLTVQLKAGATLKFQASGDRGDVLTEAARKFGVGRLDAYLSGENPDVKTNI